MAQIQQQADLENQNNINAEARELRDLEKKQTIIQNGQKALMALKNEQFGPELRTQAGQAIQTQMRWNSGGKEETTQAYSTEAMNKEALTLGDDVIQAEYIAQKKLEGIVDPVPLRRTDGKGKINPAYQKVANDALMKAPDIAKRITKIQSEVAKRVANTETMINQSANTSLQLINKQGVSPIVDPDFEPTFTNPFTPDIQTSGLPLPPVETTEGGGEVSEKSPYTTVNAANLIADGANALVDGASNNGANLTGIATSGGIVNALTKQSEGKVDDLIKGADIPKGSINNRKPIDEVPLNDTEKSKISAFKKVAKSTGAKVPDDIDILKMSSGDIKSHVMKTRKTILGRAIKRVGASSRMGKYLKNILKGTGVIGGGMLAHDFYKAVTPEEQAAIRATDELLEAHNAGSDSGESNGVSWSRK